MRRSNTSPSAGNTIVDKLKPYEGGTGQTTAAAALSALNGVPLSSINQPNGVAGLDANKKLPVTQLPIDSMSVVSVQGPSSVLKGTTTSFAITNYDVFTTYTVAAILGTVSISGDTIIYTAPSSIGSGGFTLNGRVFNVAITELTPNTPTLAVTDVPGSTGKAALQCTGSAFSVAGNVTTHASTDWQVATDSAFTAVVSQSLADTTNKTTWKSGDLNLSTTYYARVRYRDSAGAVSAYSNVVSLTTKSTYNIGTEEAKLVASDRQTNDYVGSAVAISGDGSRVVIGGYLTSQNGNTNSGCAYVFSRSGNTWVQEAKIIPSDVLAQAEFGYSVSMSLDGSRVAIGAISATNTSSNQTGAAYVYLRTGTTWALEQKFAPTDIASGFFGRSVGITSDGSRVVVGAYAAVVAGQSNVGSVYVYLRTGTTWALEQKLQHSDPNSSDQFGTSVSITLDGTRVAVGANGKQAAYIFVRASSWTQEAKIVGTGVASGNSFGYSISLTGDGTRVLVGAIYDSPSSVSQAGAAYVFVRNTSTNAWTQEAQLTASDKSASAYFGGYLCMNADGTKIAIGAYQADPTLAGTTYANAGQAYTFSRSGATWTQDSIIAPSDPATNGNFGSSCAISNDGTRMIVGAYATNSGVYGHCGASYIYR